MATLSDVANITVSKTSDEVINGNIMFNGWVNSNHRNANFVLYGYDGDDYSLVGMKREGSGIEIFGSESPNCARWLRLRSSDDSTYWSDLDVREDGVYFNWQPIIRLVESWQSGYNWYRKYSDGWIEQGGHWYCPTTDTHQTVSYNVAFVDTNYTLQISMHSDRTNVNSGHSDWIQAKSTTGCTLHLDTYPGTMNWYACGR